MTIVTSIFKGLVFFMLPITLYGHDIGGDSSNELVILHTNDLHTHYSGNDSKSNACNQERNCQGGYGQIAQLIEKFKTENPNVLVLDAGDRLQGSLAYSMSKWQGESKFEKFLPFDVATIGNHEYDEGCEELAKYIRNANYKVVAANIKITKKGALNTGDFVPYEIKNYGNIKVGIIGLASDLLSNTSPTCNNIHFSLPQKVAQEAINDLKKQGVNLIVVLSHLGIERDIELAHELKDVNIIVGGHSHKYIGPGSAIGPYPMVLKSANGKPVLMVTTNGLARFLGQLKLKVDKNGDILSWNGMPIHLGNAGGNKEISNLIEQDYEEIKKILESPVFTNEIKAKDGFDACRHGFCLSASLMAEAMAEYSREQGVEIALINGGTVRNAIPVGNVTYGDLLAAMPFNDILVIKKMKGSAIIEAIKQGISDDDGIGPRMLHAYGLRYWHNPNAPLNQRLIKAELINPNGKVRSIDPDKDYLVATTKFLNEGGDKHEAIKESKLISESNIKILDLIKEKFKNNKTFSQNPTQDINIVE